MKFRSKVTNNIRIMSSLQVKSNERRALLLTCVFFLGIKRYKFQKKIVSLQCFRNRTSLLAYGHREVRMPKPKD